jgi:hypothetical protein
VATGVNLQDFVRRPAKGNAMNRRFFSSSFGPADKKALSLAVHFCLIGERLYRGIYSYETIRSVPRFYLVPGPSVHCRSDE